MEYVTKRIKNLVDMLTSKKVIVGTLAVCAILYTASLAKIIAIGVIALGYVSQSRSVSHSCRTDCLPG